MTAFTQQQDLLARQHQEAVHTVELARQTAELEELHFARHQEDLRQKAESHTRGHEHARQVQEAAQQEEEK